MPRRAEPNSNRTLQFGTVSIVALSLALGCDWNTGPARQPTAPAPATGPQQPAQPRPSSANEFVEVTAGNQHSCARQKSGAVMCWGRNTYGQLGNGSRDDSTAMVAVTGLADAVELVAGGDFSCARRRSGAVVCWGNNQDGQLGDGRGAKVGAWSTRPTAVAGLSDAIAFGAGEAFACALRRGGKVVCWGAGASGQVGAGGERAFALPQPVTGVAKVVSLGVGGQHVCAVEQSGRVMCWGRNTEGQLGDGGIASRVNARAVQGLADAKSIIAGGRHTCALRRQGELACWGEGRQGQLGVAGEVERERTPIVTGVTGMKDIVAGGEHTCALFSASDMRCWGDNSDGQIDAGRRPKPTPAKVDGVRGVVDIAAGERHTCVVSGGKVYCWGLADRGALGPNPRS
ncbi:RCC1 domain-containing protein [Enhygromyxa salina]|uniref:RCC1 domain-containing protein n=1 Tax=Enhygromyxa salina TaxID=215803 RepID=UPI0013FCF7AC|nr:hypothetical protein [Enhygromyxa salina]